MWIHLLRHAEAEDVSGSGRDADRRLTESGERRAKAMARAIARLSPGLDEILVSPLLRARQTAEPVAAACRFEKPLRETPHLVPSAEPEEILHELGRLSAEAVLLVGHQPHLGRLFGFLLTRRRDVELAFRKAALAAFEVDGDPALDAATLRYYLPARIGERLV